MNNKMIRLLAVAILGMALTPAMAMSDDALRAKYAELEKIYNSQRKQGADVSQYDDIVRQIKRAKKKRQADQLETLLLQFEEKLDQGNAGNAPRKPHMSFSDTGESAMSGLAGKSGKYALLLRYRGADKLIDKKGIVGRNKKGFSDVAVQREAIWVLLRAINDGNEKAVQSVVNAMEYAFKQQSKDGYFRNGHKADARTAVGVDAFFLQGFARVYLLLRDSNFDKKYFNQLDKHMSDVDRALAWMSKHTDELYRQDQKATNRLAFSGLAFLLNGQILGNQKHIAIGEKFVRDALSRQRADGTFDEHGGYDSSYQAVTLLNLSLLWSYVENDALKKDIYSALEKGLDWEKSRIKPDGEVIVAGNSRTGLGQEKFFGKIKEVNYAEVALALYYSAKVTGDQSLLGLGDSVVAYAVAKQGG